MFECCLKEGMAFTTIAIICLILMHDIVMMNTHFKCHGFLSMLVTVVLWKVVDHLLGSIDLPLHHSNSCKKHHDALPTLMAGIKTTCSTLPYGPAQLLHNNMPCQYTSHLMIWQPSKCIFTPCILVKHSYHIQTLLLSSPSTVAIII